MLTRQRIVYVLIFSILLSASCSMKFFIKGLYDNLPLANKILIHKNPKVGDYSITRGNDTITKKVIAVSSDSITIRYESVVLPELIFEWVLDFEGNVKKVDLIDTAKNNQRTSCRILQPGDTGYWGWEKLSKKQLELEMLWAPESVKKRALDYEVEGLKQTAAGERYYSIYLINKNIKFHEVASYTIDNGRIFYARILVESGNRK